MLRKQGINVVTENVGAFSENPVENNHLNALNEASRIESKWVMYGDFDRLSVDSVIGEGLKRFLPKLEGYLDKNSEGLDVLTLSRDISTESSPRVLAEQPVVKLVSNVVGTECDSLGSYVIFKDSVVENIVRSSKELPPLTFPATKWVIIAKELGLDLASLSTKGLIGGFEAPELIDANLLEQKAKELERERGDFYRKFHTGSMLLQSPLQELRQQIKGLKKRKPGEIDRIH